MTEHALQLHKGDTPAVVLTRDDIRRYICPNADDKEIFMFLGICKSFGLNPMKREVHLIKYGNAPASIVTGYEVYLKRAERTGKLNGWKVDIVQDGKAATVTIHRKDWTEPFVWTAYRQEFDKGQANWKTMPLFMLRKVAMAQAFRICFPDEMGGLPYLPEEIGGNVSESLPAQVVDTTAEPIQDKPAGFPSPPPANAEPVGATPPASATEETEEDVRKELMDVCLEISGYTGLSFAEVVHAATCNKEGKYGKNSLDEVPWTMKKKAGGEWSPLKALQSKAREWRDAEKAKGQGDGQPYDDVPF